MVCRWMAGHQTTSQVCMAYSIEAIYRSSQNNGSVHHKRLGIQYCAPTSLLRYHIQNAIGNVGRSEDMLSMKSNVVHSNMHISVVIVHQVTSRQHELSKPAAYLSSSAHVALSYGRVYMATEALQYFGTCVRCTQRLGTRRGSRSDMHVQCSSLQRQLLTRGSGKTNNCYEYQLRQEIGFRNSSSSFFSNSRLQEPESCRSKAISCELDAMTVNEHAQPCSNALKRTCSTQSCCKVTFCFLSRSSPPSNPTAYPIPTLGPSAKRRILASNKLVPRHKRQCRHVCCVPEACEPVRVAQEPVCCDLSTSMSRQGFHGLGSRLLQARARTGSLSLGSNINIHLFQFLDSLP